tara:strand:- start:405 stop:1067 length:663 start_codon:yes stop_codon:yes gene_type:complete
MSISDKIINFIQNRRLKVKKNYPGEFGRFFKDGGMDTLLSHVKINEKSNVVDVGAFKGEFAEKILLKFGSNLVLLEPLINEFNILEKKFFLNKKIKLINKALSNHNKKANLLNDTNNSLITNKKSSNVIEVDCLDVKNLFDEEIEINLIKLNVEGSEYDIIEKLIDLKYLTKCKNYLIQFHHKNNKEFYERKKNIEKNFIEYKFLKVASYEYVWELWILK